MSPSPQWSPYPPQSAVSAENRRWTVMLIVLIGSLAVYAVERWLRKPDAPIVGTAFVVDGDTLAISGVRIRLLDIDAPELDQNCTDGQGRDWPCGRQASSQLRALIRGRDLTCQPQSKDQYGRTLAICSLPDKTDINAWMVQQGWAVSYDYANTYGAQQVEARAAKRGIWSGTFTPPHDWRRQHPRSSESDHNN
ncbi:MAG: thermonuclease family protein [Pseudomonadota bacterium]